ncbi:MAG TPA: galactose-1-phosphate uridylyltransferase [Candidatus Portnoybacteria bacterium]|nr:galactose-1-phosphate uridylyltransferase [Candidatus Portnoybacteria bacterium]
MEEPAKKSASELRFDLVSKDWVVIATGRAKRPETFAKQERQKIEVEEKDCPFCDLQGQEKPVLEYKKDSGDWAVAVVPNKFPAFSRAESLRERAEGPYSVMDGVGFHEVVITRDHKKSLAEMTVGEVKKVIDAYQERYLDLANEKLVNYIAIFHNHGKEAGASVAHPHSQIIAMPLIDPDLQQSLNGSKIFFETRGECVHCKMMAWDKEDKRRIVFENKGFLVVAPFASRVAFELRIIPKEHHAYFERIKEEDKELLAEALQVALNKLFKGMNDPAYNFFLHTAPVDGKDYNHYHWHFEILPKTSTWAGFELGTGIEISTVEPEAAAEYLRKIE